MTIPAPPGTAIGTATTADSTLYDLGDTVLLTFGVTDANGVDINCNTMTLTVTRPDGTAVTPAVPNPPQAVGQYQAVYVPTQTGRHTVRWVGTGPAVALTDIFYVAPADPIYLISLAEARAALARRPGTKHTALGDDELRFYIAAVTPVIQEITGVDLVAQHTWTADGGRFAIALPDIPVQIASITENGQTLATEGSDFTVDYTAGIVYRGATVAPFQFVDGRGNIVITYTTGTGVISENLRLAARIILAHLWQADQQGFRPAVGGTPDSDVVNVSGGYAIPRRAAELLQPAEDIGGFA